MQPWLFPFCFLLHHLGVSSLVSFCLWEQNIVKGHLSVRLGFLFFIFGEWGEIGKGNCGMGKERGEIIKSIR